MRSYIIAVSKRTTNNMGSVVTHEVGNLRITFCGDGAELVDELMRLRIYHKVLSLARRPAPVRAKVLLIENTAEYPADQYTRVIVNGTIYFVGIFTGFAVIVHTMSEMTLLRI